MINFPAFNFAPIMNYPENMKTFDLSKNYNPKYIRLHHWGIGKYNEKRRDMYGASQFNNKPTCAKASVGKRNIHMGIDIWTKAGSPIYAFYDGAIAYLQDNARSGDYGPTIVTKHILGDHVLYALFGHLSRGSLQNIEVGDSIKKGEQIATVGSEIVNGGWAPHLHFQLSLQDPAQADMPGVVADKDHEEALELYPDPQIVLGEIM